MSMELRQDMLIDEIRCTLLEKLKTLPASKLVTFWNEYAKGIHYDSYGVIDTFRNDIDEDDLAYRIDAIFFGHESYCYGLKAYMFVTDREELYQLTTDNFDMEDVTDENALLLEHCYNIAVNEN